MSGEELPESDPQLLDDASEHPNIITTIQDEKKRKSLAIRTPWWFPRFYSMARFDSIKFNKIDF